MGELPSPVEAGTQRARQAHRLALFQAAAGLVETGREHGADENEAAREHEDQRLQADLRQSDRQDKAGNGEDRAISEADLRNAPHVAPAGREPAIGRIEGHFPNGVGRRHKRTRPLLGFGL